MDNVDIDDIVEIPKESCNYISKFLNKRYRTNSIKR